MNPTPAFGGNPRIAVGYIRVADGEVECPACEQRSRLERWADMNGVDVVAWCEDPHTLGDGPAPSRTGFRSAIDQLGRHGAGWLLVARRDRLASTPVDEAVAEHLVCRAGARVVAADGDGELSEQDVRMRNALLGALTAYEDALADDPAPAVPHRPIVTS